MKRIISIFFCVSMIVYVLLLTACYSEDPVTINDTSGNNSEYNTESFTKSDVSYEDATNVNDTSVNNSEYNTQSVTERKVSRYCDASSCLNEGVYEYEGIGGQTEYYCYTHYNEIMSIISDMEEDVGNGAYSKHTCEECGREGTYSIIGFSGLTEYYCTTHYYELKELLEMFS